MQSIELHQCSSTSLKNGICRTESRDIGHVWTHQIEREFRTEAVFLGVCCAFVFVTSWLTALKPVQ